MKYPTLDEQRSIDKQIEMARADVAAASKRCRVLLVLLVGCTLGFGAVPAVLDVITVGECGLSEQAIYQIGTWIAAILLIVAAIVGFYVSKVFKYASLLQWFYDETF